MVGPLADGVDIAGGKQAVAANEDTKAELAGVAVGELPGDAQLFGGVFGGVEGRWLTSGHRL